MANSKNGVWDRSPIPCSQCGRPYRADLLKQCPGCASKSLGVEPSVSTPLMAPSSYSRNETTFDDLVRAQNRTTHAVRAFVRFLFIQLSGITCAVFIWNISLAMADEQSCYQSGRNCTGNTFLQFVAGVVWIIAVIWSSKAGWEELDKSNI